MASLRDIRSRINSVRNTQHLTRAMKMVAAARLRRSQERIFKARPYAYTLKELITRLRAHSASDDVHPYFVQRDEVKSALLIVITADRGLAGAFNSNAIKRAEQEIENYYAEHRANGTLDLLCIGRKGYEHFAKRGYNIIKSFIGVFDNLTFDVAADTAAIAVQGFEEERWDEVKVVYNEFKNTISQNRIAEPFLPIPDTSFMTPVMEEHFEALGEVRDGTFEYIFEPGPDAILEALVPRYLNLLIWRALLESNAAEQGARMVAMDNATSNAQELLRDLTLKYNRARQSAITTEIIEITSGANALEAS